MGPECQMNCNYKGCFNTEWRFGAGAYDGTYALKNFLAIKEKPESEHMLEYMSDQYRKYIVNRVTVKMFNFGGCAREVLDPLNKLQFQGTWDKENVIHPWDMRHNYEIDDNPGSSGMFATTFRAHSLDDVNLKLHTSFSDTSIRIGLLGSRAVRRKSIKFYYYPRCKKAITTGLANMPGYKDWKDILTGMGVDDPFFMCGLGFGPFVSYPQADNKGVAASVQLFCMFQMSYKLTFSDRKPNNLMNMHVGDKMGGLNKQQREYEEQLKKNEEEKAKN